MLVWLFMCVSISQAAVLASTHPSLCNNGFFDNQQSPLMLGKGFGPPAYRELFEQWKVVRADESFTEQEKEGINLLLTRMSDCDRKYMREEVLSGIIASSFQMILPRLAKSGEEKLWFEHQLCVPSKTASYAHIAITNARDSSHLKIPLVHGIVEVKWALSDNEFPEMQATAVARLFNNAGSLRHTWVPIFVLTKSHFSLGIAFRFFDLRWAYSEICVYQLRQTPSHAMPEDVLMLCRFFRFMLSSGMYHQKCAIEDDQGLLVDNNGLVLFKTLPRIIGDRVLCGTSRDEAYKVIKFYFDKASAENAVENKRKMEAAFGLVPTHCPIIEGCGDGFCAVVDKHISSADKISIEHLKILTKLVSSLYNQELLHGDLRLPNIIFGEDSTVTLIDFEWAGEVSKVKFPDNVNIAAFGKRAKLAIAPGAKIPANFDWLCLADLFDCFENDGLVKAACELYNENKVLGILGSLKENEQALSKLVVKGKDPAYVYFGSFSPRIRAYFEKQRESVPKNAQTRKRKRAAAGIS